MPGLLRLCVLLLLAQSAACGNVLAEEPLTLENVPEPGKNLPDEPRDTFSLPKAARFLDTAALSWTKKRGCFTCHTNYAYLYARPAINADVPEHRTIREQAELLVTERWVDRGPRWDAEVIGTAAALAYNDAATTGKLHGVTKTALDFIWQRQREDGGFSWIKCGWPPMESDDHYGVTLAAIAVGVAPEDYAKSEKALKGLEGIRKYLKESPSPTPHHRMMILWASTLVDGLMTEDEQRACVDEIWGLQNEDGGWSTSMLHYWKRADNKAQTFKVSDGYGTGFALFVLRKAGVTASDGRIQRGVQWLKSNQRESGRWFTRSLNKDNMHFLTHAGTAFAVMALKECENDAKVGAIQERKPTIKE